MTSVQWELLFLNLADMKITSIYSQFMCACVREIFWFYDWANNITGSKDTQLFFLINKFQCSAWFLVRITERSKSSHQPSLQLSTDMNVFQHFSIVLPREDVIYLL